MTTVAAVVRSTNAHASQMNPHAASPVKSPRRVLGELAQNAHLTPKHAYSHAKPSFATAPSQSPLKAQDALQSSVRLTEKENGSVIPGSASRKRPYSSMESSCRRDVMGSPAKRQHETRVETVSPALLRSTMPPPVVIELADDDSDTNDDEPREASNIPDNEHIDLPSATQGTTGSFSSLIDYNPRTASDGSDTGENSSASSRSTPVTSRVELLKLRLKMAMYKINTNQTLVPFADLEVPHARTMETVATEDDDEEALPEAHQVDTDENCDAPANIVIKAGPVGKMLAAPIFAPTAFSSRFIEGPNASYLRRQLTPATSPSRLYARDEGDLTSSVVKTHAATGLLELAHAV